MNGAPRQTMLRAVPPQPTPPPVLIQQSMPLSPPLGAPPPPTAPLVVGSPPSALASPLPPPPRLIAPAPLTVLLGTVKDVSFQPWLSTRFLLLDKLGEGSFGQVFWAIDQLREQDPLVIAARLEVVQTKERWDQLSASSDASYAALTALKAKMDTSPTTRLMTAQYQRLASEFQTAAAATSTAYAAWREASDRVQGLIHVVIKRLNRLSVSEADIRDEMETLKQLQPVCATYILCWDDRGVFYDKDHFYMTTEYLQDYVPLENVIPILKADLYHRPPLSPLHVRRSRAPRRRMIAGYESGGVDVKETEAKIGEESVDPLPPPPVPVRVVLPLNQVIERAVEIAGNLVNGVRTMHAVGVAHKDLKPANLLVQRNGSKIKIIDFGLACRTGGPPCSEGGSRPWFSPEILLGYVGNVPPEKLLASYQKSDLWALGILLYEMLSPAITPTQPGRPPLVLDHWLENRRLLEQFVPSFPPQTQIGASEFAREFEYRSRTDPLSLISARLERQLQVFANTYAVLHPQIPKPHFTLTTLLEHSPAARQFPLILPLPTNLSITVPTIPSLSASSHPTTVNILYPPTASLSVRASLSVQPSTVFPPLPYQSTASHLPTVGTQTIRSGPALVVEGGKELELANSGGNQTIRSGHAFVVEGWKGSKVANSEGNQTIRSSRAFVVKGGKGSELANRGRRLPRRERGDSIISTQEWALNEYVPSRWSKRTQSLYTRAACEAARQYGLYYRQIHVTPKEARHKLGLGVTLPILEIGLLHDQDDDIFSDAVHTYRPADWRQRSLGTTAAIRHWVRWVTRNNPSNRL